MISRVIIASSKSSIDQWDLRLTPDKIKVTSFDKDGIIDSLKKKNHQSIHVRLPALSKSIELLPEWKVWAILI